MTPALCVRGCTIRARHTSDDCTEECNGCLPARAVDGLAVCSRCERTTRDGLRDLAGLWADLGDPRRSPIPRQGGRSDDGPPLLISDAARAARSAIRAVLVSWCLVLEEDYRLTLPADTVRAMAHHVAVQAGRLLASEHADQLVHDIKAAMKGRSLLQRSSGLRIQCDCGEWVAVAETEDQIMTCRGCDTWGLLSWWVKHAPTTDGPLALKDLPAHLLVHQGIEVTVAQLRTWADRGYISPLEEPGRVNGRTAPRRFDPVVVAAVALKRAPRRTATPADPGHAPGSAASGRGRGQTARRP